MPPIPKSLPRGIDLINQLRDGQIQVAPSDYLLEVRDKVSADVEELIDVGARVRPLLVDKHQVGWVRGVHLSERKAFKRWVKDDVEFANHLVRLGSTLTQEEVDGLSLLELRSLARLVHTMTESDLRLYSFIGAFVTTSTSEQLWFSRGPARASPRVQEIVTRAGRIPSRCISPRSSSSAGSSAGVRS